MQEPASSTWTPDEWNCCSGMEEKYPSLHRGRGCAGCDHGAEDELDYLIYNDPLGYADLILNGDPEEYLKNVAGSHGLES